MKSGVHHFSYVLFLSLAMSLFHSVLPGSLNEISHWNEKTNLVWKGIDEEADKWQE